MGIQLYWEELESRESMMKKVIRNEYDLGSQQVPEVEGHD